MRSKACLPADPEEFTKVARGQDERAPRRFRIKKEDLEKFGCPADFPGCRAANRCTTAVGHTEERM